MPSNESVIPTVSVSAITKLNGKIGIVNSCLVSFGGFADCLVLNVCFQYIYFKFDVFGYFFCLYSLNIFCIL